MTKVNWRDVFHVLNGRMTHLASQPASQPLEMRIKLVHFFGYMEMLSLMKLILIAIFASITLPGCSMMAYRDNLRAIERNSHQEVANYSMQTREYIIENGEKKAMEAAMLSVKNGLKDPESATFRNVRTARFLEGIVVCGEYNARNSYGGYVGFNRFVASPSSATTYDTSSGNTDIIWATNVGINSACN